jgi:hypothetical protein
VKRRIALPLGLALAVAVGPLRAQSPALDAIEAAADSGRVERASELLGAWLASPAATAPDAEVGRALLLRARLATDPDSAEADYLEAALKGGSRTAATARLRLAQLRFTRGELGRAAADLDRLRADYPGMLDAPAWLWTGYVREAEGEPGAACTAWEKAAAVPGPDARDAASLAAAALGRCRAGAGGAGADASLMFTVQLGAFGSREAARAVQAEAARTGLAIRVEAPPTGGGLYRVRTGRFARREDAAHLAVRLRAEGLEAIVVPEEP